MNTLIYLIAFALYASYVSGMIVEEKRLSADREATFLKASKEIILQALPTKGRASTITSTTTNQSYRVSWEGNVPIAFIPITQEEFKRIKPKSSSKRFYPNMNDLSNFTDYKGKTPKRPHLPGHLSPPRVILPAVKTPQQSPVKTPQKTKIYKPYPNATTPKLPTLKNSQEPTEYSSFEEGDTEAVNNPLFEPSLQLKTESDATTASLLRDPLLERLIGN